MIARIVDRCVIYIYIQYNVRKGCTCITVHHLQANLKKALLEQNVEYRGEFLTAFVEVMAPDEESSALPHTSRPKHEEKWLQECVEVLFTDLESDRGGPVLISTALCAVSLLLSQRYTCQPLICLT